MSLSDDVSVPVTLTNVSSSGGGDSVKNDLRVQKVGLSKLRTQVPSCRRFCTRPPPQDVASKQRVKVELQRAIWELATNPKITRRKSLTMAEIHPTRTAAMNRTNYTPATSTPLSTPSKGLSKNLPQNTRKHKELCARRRVCQILLLNAWRRRREQVSSLSESLVAVQTQNSQLEVQIDALRRLRQSECDKRNEAVMETQHLASSLNESQQEKRQLVEMRDDLEKKVKLESEQNQKLMLEVKNTLNEWHTARNDIQRLEQRLDDERNKIKLMREEKISLTEQLTQKELKLAKLNQKIDTLENKLFQTKVSLEDMMHNSSQQDMTLRDIESKLENALAENARLMQECTDLKDDKTNLENKVQKLQGINELITQSQNKLQNENGLIKTYALELKNSLLDERNRPWWKNVKDLATLPVYILLELACIMLPALPNVRTVDIASPRHMMRFSVASNGVTDGLFEMPSVV